MITAAQMAESFDRNTQILKMQAAGLSHADSLAQLPFRGNCMNWIVGHIVASRAQVLRLLGQEPALPPEVAARYLRESDPITPESPDAMDFEQLMAALDLSQQRVAAGLASATHEDLARQETPFGRRTETVGYWLFFFYFHDSYHTGQTEILRQAAGKDDKII